MTLVLILMPLAMGAAAMVLPSNRYRPWLLPATGVIHLVLTVLRIARTDQSEGDWLFLDPPGRLVLLLVSVLYALCSVYAIGYLRYREDRPNRVFCACFQAFLGTMTLIVCSHHLGLMWVALEATTLLSAPLIYFNRNPRSIEATWKYLLVGSVGIALALLGSFFLAYASIHQGLNSSLRFDDLLKSAPRLSKPWLHAAFVFLLVGYGTKMGLAPVHTWKPDAYGEAPGLVGAMLAGGLTSCAFLALLRISHICVAAGEGAYSGKLLVFMGLFSMLVAGIFMVGQKDFKRMLAYSSVEHMGILALGVGMGGAALFPTLLHLVNNGLTKGILFLSAGNIHRAYGSKNTDDVTGAARRLPLSGSLFMLGFLAITGSPPFGPFVSEFGIVSAAVGAGRFWVASLFLLFLMVVFVGMGQAVLRVVQGRPSERARTNAFRDGFLTGAPMIVSATLVLVLGLSIPGPLKAILDNAVRYFEGRP
jgi:hydrogenase-4 component F